jgi:DNA ligase (NAD+)
MLDDLKIQQIATQKILLENLTTSELAEFCQFANSEYRRGEPIISDDDYDFIFLAELQQRNPNHPFLQQLENEEIDFGDKLLLPKPMLSTDKAYTFTEIEKFCERLTKAASEIKLDPQDIVIKTTPKLDGFAAFDDGKILYTRGDGKKGSDISRVFSRGLAVFNKQDRGLGAGEIVISKSYFNTHLKGEFEHPRNFTASIIKEKALDNKVKKAIDVRAAVFVPFAALPYQKFSIDVLLGDFENIISHNLVAVDFDVDGVILEAINTELREYMGSNRKFHRFQIAYKENKESKQVRVLEVKPQVGRTGKITPVAILEPTLLSGATITHATCHHYGMVKAQNLGVGSVVELVRSGQVIPKITKVLQATQAFIPTKCPSCESILEWESDFLLCLNHNNCPEQIIGRMEHFFKVLDNNDGFGKQTINKLFAQGITQVSEIYQLQTQDFITFGFGEKTSQNLQTELVKSRTVQIEDYRFLSAFGVERLGLGNSENLLKNYPLSEIFNLSVEQIAAIDGFAEITASSIQTGLAKIQDEFNTIFALGFNLEITNNSKQESNIFSDNYLVFSGAMTKSRDEMEKQAKAYGAKVQKSVNTKTNYLIIGEKVGQSKLNKARELGVKILTESEYLATIS